MPLLWISLAFLIGIFLGASLPGTGAWFWAAAGGIFLLAWPVLHRLPTDPPILRRLGWAARRQPHLRLPPVLLLVFLCAGAARVAYTGPGLDPTHIAAYNDRGPIWIRAIISAPPDHRDSSTLLRLEVEAVAALDAAGKPLSPRPAHGQVQAVLPASFAGDYGDRLTLSAEPGVPPQRADFSYRAYLERQDIYTYIVLPHVLSAEPGTGNPFYAAIYAFRDWALGEIYRIFPSPEAPLLAGILLGIDQAIPPDLTQAFQDTGTAHVIAISGFNIAILAALFSRLFGSFLTRGWATIAAILAVIFYTLLVGATPSVVRAAIMGSLALVAEQIGRRSTVINSLALSAGLMCLFNPLLPWDASFQLSFLATLGLVTFGSRFQDGFTAWLNRSFPTLPAEKITAPIGEYVLLTLAAQLMTLPVILYHFQRLSLSSLLANPLILPVQPLLMILSGAAVLAGLVFQPLAQLIAWLAWPLSAYTIRVVEALAGLPGGVLIFNQFGLPALLLCYAGIAAYVLGWRLPGLGKAILRPGLLIAVLLLLTFFTWRAVFTRPDGRLHLIAFNLGGSQVLLIRGPGGENILVNGGPSPTLLGDALGRWLSPFDRRLDALVLNSAQATFLDALPTTLERYRPARALWGCAPGRGRASADLIDTLSEHGIPIHTFQPGEALAAGDSIRLEILAVSDQGSAILLRWNNFRALIPAGIPPQQIRREDRADLGVLILVKSDLANQAEWLRLAPQALIYTPTSGELPPEEQAWLVIPPQGWVHVTTDGKKMWVEKK
jgi:competence protein ComEC